MSKPEPTISSYRTVVVSSLVSVGDIGLSLIVAVITGSSVMIAQGLQGMADLTTTLLLLVGVKKSRRAATPKHPFGYGRELFFWVLISSLFAFLFSGGLAAWRAIQQILNPGTLESIPLAIIILAFGLVTNSYALSNSVRRLAQGMQGKSIWVYLRNSSLVETKMTLLVDLMGTLSALTGLFALIGYLLTGNVLFDGVGALLIALTTAGGALFVIVDLHDLIVGRSPSPIVVEAIRKTALKVSGVQDVLDLQAVTIGSGQFFVILEIHFSDDLNTDEIEKLTDTIKAKVIKQEPQVSKIQVEAETPDHELKNRRRRR